MKRDIIFLFLFIIMFGLLPGCGQVYDWSKEQFNQGKEFKNEDAISEVRKQIKSSTVYDLFSVVGKFDSLWLSDNVRDLYVNLFALKNKKSEEQMNVFLRRQLEENNHFISFYVLSLIEIPLGGENSNWTIFLRIGDKIYRSNEQPKIIDLPPIYIDLFGKKYSKFKDVYLIYFNAKDIENNFIITPEVDKISLVFRSVNKEVDLSWDVKQNLARIG